MSRWMVGAGGLAWALVTACGDSGGGGTGPTATGVGPASASDGSMGTPITGTGSDTGGSSEDTGSTETPTTAPAPVCGDGVVDEGEGCDEGAANADDAACTLACAPAACGDGLTQAGVEGCDDGNLDAGDGCSATCTLESCGDGVVSGDEACDDGNQADDDDCLNLCVAASCGDAVVWTGKEECDDGNPDDTDACLATCAAASCGDGAVWAGMEDCDDGNADEADSCTSGCKLPSCSDNAKNGDESDVDCGGGVCPKCGLDKACVQDLDCASGTCSDGKCGPPASCKAILAGDPAAKSGEYTVDLDGVGPLMPYKVICDMTTDGGGWTVFYATNGTDAQQPLTGNNDVLGNNPLQFLPYNHNRARKVALSQISGETIFVRANSIWLRADKPAFDATLLVANSVAAFAVNLVTSDGVMAPAFMGWSIFNIAGGGDFGVSLSPDAATCNGVTVMGFDHHGANYWQLNCGCQRQYLYSYSAQFLDGDAGYDVNTALGAWTATQACQSNEGGALQFYAGMR